MTSGGPSAHPGAALLHPAALGAVAVLVVNDHWGKAAFPGFLTGKLSDVAGLVFFPLLLQALWEIGQRWRARPRPPSFRVLGLCVLATGVVFSLIQIWPLAGDAYRVGLGALQWPLHAVGALVDGRGLPGLSRVSLTADPTDLIALPALGAALWIGSRQSVARPPPNGGRARASAKARPGAPRTSVPAGPLPS